MHYFTSTIVIIGYPSCLYVRQDNIQELMKRTKKQRGVGTSTQDNEREARIDRLTDLVERLLERDLRRDMGTRIHLHLHDLQNLRAMILFVKDFRG